MVKMNDYMRFIAISRYARWVDGRRETWGETVNRCVSFYENTFEVLEDEEE